MKRYLLDTGAAGDFINRRRGVAARVRAAGLMGHRVGVSMPKVAELFAGLELSRTPERNRKRLLHGLAELTVWPFDFAAAQRYGKLFADLRRSGPPMQQIDIQIAATALTLGHCVVVTTDSDFQAIPGLRVEDWRE